MTPYTIPCQHITEGLGTDQTVSDYHPLTLEAIRDLLFTAKAVMSQEDGQLVTRTVNDIQCRLQQGIAGFVCPHEIEGPVARRQAQLGKLYVEYVEGKLTSYSDEGVAQELYALMQA